MTRALQSLVFTMTPPTRMYRLRSAALRFRYAEVAACVRVVASGRFYVDRLALGEGTFIGHGFRAYGGSGSALVIGARCDIGPVVVVLAGSHAMGTSQRRAGAGRASVVTIGDGAWIGGRVTIVGPCRIGAGAVIAAGAVVRGEVPADHLFRSNGDVVSLD